MSRLATVSNNAHLRAIDVSIVMPCLNEARCLPHCIENAQDALVEIHDRLGLSGEIVISDNGSDDGSQAIARSLGAVVVHCRNARLRGCAHPWHGFGQWSISRHGRRRRLLRFPGIGRNGAPNSSKAPISAWAHASSPP